MYVFAYVFEMIIIFILYVSGTTKYGDLCRYRTMEKFNKKWDKGEKHQLHDAIQTSTNSKNVEYFHLLRYVNSFLYIISIKTALNVYRRSFSTFKSSAIFCVDAAVTHSQHI